jgi:biopolymer transport protein ExbB/TolQ
MVIELSTSELFIVLSIFVIIYFFLLYIIVVLKERARTFKKEQKVFDEYKNLRKQITDAQKKNTEEFIGTSVLSKYRDLENKKGKNINDEDMWNAKVQAEDEFLYFKTSIKKDMANDRLKYDKQIKQNTGDEKRVNKHDIS